MIHSLDDVIITADFHRRPSRSADYQAENTALIALTQVLTDSPQALLQYLVEITLDICHADTVGISLLQPGENGGTFNWVAIAGEYAPYVGGTTQWDFSPCGITLQHNAPQLFSYPGRYFTYFNEVEPPIVEGLLVPFELRGKPTGTIWIVSHNEQKKFDGEDLRLITSLSNFAAAAFSKMQSENVLQETRDSVQLQARIFDTTLSSIVDFAYIFDKDGRFIYANQALVSLLEITVEQIAGKNFFDLNYPDDLAARLQRQIQQVFETKELLVDETPFTSPSGVDGYYEYIFCPVIDADGNVEVVAGSTRNISERKRTTEEHEQLTRQLEAAHARLQYLFDYAPTFVAFLRGPNHTFEIVNPAYHQLVGHRELIGKTVRAAFPDIEGQGFFELLDQVYETGKTYIGLGTSIFLQREPDSLPEERFIDFIYQAFFEIDGSVSGIFAHGVDVTEQVTARKAVEEANRLKDEFLATLSHELRNPLNNILGYSEILRRSPEGKQSPLVRQAANTIHNNAQVQAQLINDLLDLSRLQTGKLTIERHSLYLAPVIGDAVETVRAQAGEKGIKLHVDLAAEQLSVNADPVRIQQIVWNLVNNAVKFTQKGGQIWVRLSRENNETMLVIEDNGQGMAPEFIPHVFDMFRQADASTTRKHGGMGIGLALVHQLTELHDGRVEVYSAGVGQGARFTIWLPLNRLPLIAQTIISSPQTKGELSGAHILVADDTQDSLDVLRLLLNSEGAVVETALSGIDALKVAGNLDFDLIISDISMPEMDGYEFLQSLRENPRYSDTPAIALTGFGRNEDVERAQQAGFTTHLTKPLDFDQLVKIVRLTLQK